jgi:ferrochelatase
MSTGVLLINLGTPKSFSVNDVKTYLTEFLLDPLVIDLPWPIRQLLVRGLIIPKRKKESAHLYEKIWTENGSPLMVHGKALKNQLQISLGEPFIVELAMRYQELPIEEKIDVLLKKGVKKIIFIPLFPQYAEATTGSIVKVILQTIKKRRFFPEFTIVSHYETMSKMIEAYIDNIKRFDVDEYDHLLLSFHGLPIRHLKKLEVGCLKEKNCCERKEVTGCYRAQCIKTAKAIQDGLQIDPDKVSISFQSRLGKDPWIEPYTIETARKLLEKGKKKILVACPAFVADCIETLSEIALEYQEEFIKMGGEKFTLVPSLNDHPIWVEGLKELVLSRL